VGTVNDLLGGKGQTAGALTAAAEGSSGVPGPVTAAQPPATNSAGVAAAKPPATSSAGVLRVPTTGTTMGLGGLLLVIAGAGALMASLRRRRDA